MNESYNIPEQIYEENRPWGKFRRFTQNQNATVKIITVNPDQSLSLQTHEKRSEFWRIISGSGKVEIGDSVTEVSKGDELYIPLGSTHRATSSQGGLEILEIATGEFDENDIKRLEDKYGRE